MTMPVNLSTIKTRDKPMSNSNTDCSRADTCQPPADRPAKPMIVLPDGYVLWNSRFCALIFTCFTPRK